ncbi:MAG TPA: lipocalin-like domain-containing protein [Burkholderiales bacterium]|nr:lipocalin-like domain-containing protein [Burkholderiales bacterium]
MRRRAFLALSLLPAWARAEKVQYPVARPRPLVFPRDHGAHPDYRSEWWYVTGWLDGRIGFQVTFFRARPEEQSDNPSRFNPRQILFAHAAIADPKVGHLVHDQLAARAGLSLAGMQTERTGVWIDDWSLLQEGDSYRTKVAAREFDFSLTLTTTGKPVLQGENGFSRKGGRPEEASYYYSQPQLAVSGSANGKQVSGTAWLDHEWSSAYLAPEAAGWDWCGINFFNGQSLMAFQMRAKAGGIYYAPRGVSLRPLRTWKSPRTGVEYPVSMQVNDLRLEPLMDDQELDARASVGTIYWEGAVRAFRGKEEVGRGYLELTGYWKPMKL